MAANCTGTICKCYEAGIYEPHETPLPSSFLIVATVHTYLVVVLGTLCNGVAIWCVATCKKTRTPVKVLLFSVFVPLLLICLVTQSMGGEMLLDILNCDSKKTTRAFRVTTGLLYSFLAQVELACIAALAIVRAVAVWSRQRHTLRLRVAVAIVISIVIYSFFSGVGILGALSLDYVQDEHLRKALSIAYFLTSVMLPFLLTTIAYALMLYAMRQNRQRLAACESRTTTSGTLDQATRAMLAVFISNLVFGFPHAIYHVWMEYVIFLALIIHMLFYTHFLVDPVVFIWYNSHYRERVRKKVHEAWVFIGGCCRTSLPRDSIRKISSALPLWKSSLSVDQKSSSSENPIGTPLPPTGLTDV